MFFVFNFADLFKQICNKIPMVPYIMNGNLHQSGFTATILDRESHQDANMIESSNCPQVNI